MKVAICTLGCKVNQYETQALEQELLHRGHTLVDFEETADAYVVNTCSVTAVSDKKSRQMLRQAQRRNPSAVIAACGCYAQTHSEDVKKLGLDVIAGTNDRAKFIDLLERAAQDKTPIVDVDDVWERRDFEVLPAGGMVNRTRAMLKVEDGCVNFCTYCLIPYARGRVRSLPMDEAAKQVKALREEGYREIVVTGIEISSYGSDFKDGTSLIDLLELIAREGGDMRIRLGSLEPRTITEEFCKRASKLPYLCPHFHLSMQSGCDATLKRMNRKYDTARYMESCDLLRQYFDDPAITTDLITAFPRRRRRNSRRRLTSSRASALPTCTSSLIPSARARRLRRCARSTCPCAKSALRAPRLSPRRCTKHILRAAWARSFPCSSSATARAAARATRRTIWRYPSRRKACTIR